MRNLTLLTTPPDYIQRYVDIRERKMQATRSTLTAAHPFVTARYDAYQAASGALETLTPTPSIAALKTSLRACYSATQRRDQLLKDIEDAQPNGTRKYCYLCQTTYPGGWDHYLPSELFPEFSVFAPNLVPCCSTCNSRKDDDWLNAQGKRQYIHFGYDPIPNVQFLGVTLITSPKSSAVGARFFLRQAGISQPQWDLISSHFTRLKLIASYDSKVNDEINSALDSCCIHIANNGKDVVNFLNAHSVREAGLFGINHWRAVLFRAMVVHQSFPDWVASRM